jgi:two-component system sensor histidine kinase MprB
MSLRSRLALMFGVLALVVSALVSLAAFRSTSSELAIATDDFLEDRANDVSDGQREPPNNDRDERDSDEQRPTPLPFDPDAIVQTLNRFGEITAAAGGTLPVTEASAEIATDRSRRNSRTVKEFEDITLDGESYRMITQSVDGGGAVQVARSTEESEQVLNDLVERFVLITIVVGLLASVVGWWVARSTTRPLRRLGEVAADVADTQDFSTRVDIDRPDEIGQLASSFAKMLAALETSREQQHRLIHDASHELRTPLTSLSANVALLERAGTLPAKDRAELIAAVKAELDELNELFDELIELATDRYDEATAPMTLVDLDDVVRSTVERWERRIDRVISIDSSSAMVLADESMLERALTNLLANANKFSPPGEPIAIVAQGGSVRVQDHGPGVDPADRERVFDRFYRSDATRSMPGSGLGLAIVAQIVDHHGGDCWVSEAPGGGAEIGFRIPLSESDESNVVSGSESQV